LKPDVCRRVVGRLPSHASKAACKSSSGFNSADGATIQLLSLAGLKTMVVYLVRSFGLMPESVSHDWHVQPSCQRPNRGPPRRCEFSPGDLATRAKPTVLETLQTYSAAVNPVNRRIPQDFQMISTSGKRDGRARPQGLSPNPSRSLAARLEVAPFPIGDELPIRDGFFHWALGCAQQYGLPSGVKRHFRRAFYAARYGRQEIEKRSYFGGSLL
jgi:hypothetical protein